MKRVIFRFFRPVVHSFLRLFFDEKYLTGRFFTESYGGYVWALRAIWVRNILRLEKPHPWPVHASCYISNPMNINFHPDDLNNFQARGAYFQCISAKISIGKGVYIAPNVGLITSNHDITDPTRHIPGMDIVIGSGCWLGMNSVVLPGVHLGDGTVVAAGAVVSKSFEKGGVVIGGVPAKVIKSIKSSKLKTAL